MRPPLLYLILTVLLVTAVALGLPRTFYPLRALENMVEDVRIAFLAPMEPQSQDIVIVTIDDQTLARFPYRSPIDRRFLAQLIRTLDRAKVRAIGLDVLLDQPTERDKDAALRQALVSTKAPLVAITTLDLDRLSEAQVQFHKDFLAGIQTGFANLETERVDATVRAFRPLVVTASGTQYSFPAAIARALGVEIPAGPALIAWRAPPDRDHAAFPAYPAHALKRIPPAWIEGRIALIGADLSRTDRHRTPRYLNADRGLSPGVEIHAQVLSQLLHQRSFPRAPFGSEALWTLLLAAAGAFLIFWRRGLWLKGSAAFAILGLAWAGAFLLYRHGGPLLPLVLPTLGMGLAAGSSAALSAFYSRRRAMELNAAYQESQARLKETDAAKARIEQDLSMARDIQLNMVPSTFPAFPGREDFDLHAIMDPAKAVGGDLYDFFLVDEDHLFFLIGDVSDKGVPAALFMAMTKTLFKSAITKAEAKTATDLVSVMFTVNGFLADNNASQQFVTIFACILDTRDGSLLYSDGGHDPPFVLHHEGWVERVNKKSGMAMGCFPGVSYESATLSLQPGDAFLLYTDGVNEAMNSRREMFDYERIEQTLAPLCRATPTQEITTTLFRQVKAFTGEAPQSDDITVLAIRFWGSEGPASADPSSQPPFHSQDNRVINDENATTSFRRSVPHERAQRPVPAVDGGRQGPRCEHDSGPDPGQHRHHPPAGAGSSRGAGLPAGRSSG